MRIETNRDRAASMAQKNEAVACARQKERERRLEAQGCTDYLFGAINRHSAEAPVASAAVPQAKQETPKVVEKATDTLTAMSVLAALAVISVIVCMNVLWFM